MDTLLHTIPSTYGTRFYHEPQPYTYPFGNTPARDFLEYASSDLEEPSVLVLGCGDIRSCFYTIWKNFTSDFEKRFRGVHFVLNDRSAAVQARNILFIYLCLKLPEDTESRQKWVHAMWGIWFCHELLPDHESVLRDALKDLLTFSTHQSQWSSTGNPLQIIVTFFTPDALQEIRRYWSIWFNREVTVSVWSMRLARTMKQSEMIPNTGVEVIQGMHEICGVLGQNLCADQFKTMTMEFQAYLNSGNAYSESLTDLGIQTEEGTVNLTFFDRADGSYTVHYGSSPYRCFHHKYPYNYSQMRKLGMHIPDHYDIAIDPKKYRDFPLLASSFQQFSTWILGTACAFQRKEKVSFMFDTSDAFHFSNSWKFNKGNDRFDLVFASNVMDSVSPPAFVLAGTQLLTENGLFLSASISYRRIASTFSEYIKVTFGILPSMLPLVCGIRCVNHEGPEYSSLISHQHIPVDVQELEKSYINIYESTFIWKTVDMTPLYASSIETMPEVIQALYNSFKVSCTRLLFSEIRGKPNNHVCTDTAILILREFASRLDPVIAISHNFWTHLCTCLKVDQELKPFLSSIQTQAILNGLHLHLLVDDSNCPTCKRLPVSSYLCQFSVEIKATQFQANFIMIRLTKSSDIHYIDCFSQIVLESSNFKIFFVAPSVFVKEDYDLVLVQYMQLHTGNQPSDLLKGKLRGYQIDTDSLSILSLPGGSNLKELLNTISLGTIISHSGKKDSFETKISLTDKPALLTGELKVIQPSPSSVEIKCVEDSAVIKYPYPITKLVVRRSKKDKSLTILASRLRHEYESDGQLFHVNPNDHSSLVPVMPQSELLESLLRCQFSPKEWDIFCEDDKFKFLVGHPLIKVKRTIFLWLTLTDDFFFWLQIPDPNDDNICCNAAIVKVVNRVVDVTRKSPAIDVHFCFLDTLDQQNADFIINQMKGFLVKEFFLSNESYNLLKRIVFSFQSYTHQCKESYPLVKKPPSLEKCKIMKYFKRAVIYPLYQDRDRDAQERLVANPKLQCHFIHQNYGEKAAPECSSPTKHEQQQTASLQPSCTHCGKSGQMKKCSRCHKASYCGKECQTKDWKRHKKICKPDYKDDLLILD